MNQKMIIIDGYIGPYGYSKQFIRNELTGQEKNEVKVKISSLGGNIDDAISIYDQIIEHGNVQVELSAFVASAATLISLGAKKIKMNENSFYLIHKAMNWVDEWGRMNEDDLEEIINKLEHQKQQLAKVTLTLAKMYVKKTGKSLEDITGLMKKQIWLNAEEALQWGFIDEIVVPEVSENYMDNHQMVAMINSIGYPMPERKKQNENSEKNENEDSLFERIYKKILASMGNTIIKNKSVTMEKTFKNLNSVLQIEGFEGNEEGAFLNTEQLDLLENHIQCMQQLSVENAQLINDLEETRNQLSDLQTVIENGYSSFDEIDVSIKNAGSAQDKANAIKLILSGRPGTVPAQTLDKNDEANTEEINWKVIDNLSHNKKVDNNI